MQAISSQGENALPLIHPRISLSRAIRKAARYDRAIRFSVRYYIRDYSHALHDAYGSNVL